MYVNYSQGPVLLDAQTRFMSPGVHFHKRHADGPNCPINNPNTFTAHTDESESN